MNIQQRRIYSTVFIVLFAVSAPVLIFFAAGFRLNVASRSIFETGTLVVKSQPSDALILLNGQSTGFRSPHTFNRIEPKNLDITLQKDGFADWKGSVMLAGGKSVILDDILLVSNAPAQNIMPKARGFFLSPSGNAAAITSSDNGEFTVSLLRFSLIERASPLPERLVSFRADDLQVSDWSPQEEEIIVARTSAGQKTYAILSLRAPFTFTTLPIVNADALFFDQSDASFLFVQNTDNSIERTDRALLNKTRQPFSGTMIAQDADGIFLAANGSLSLYHRNTGELTTLADIHDLSPQSLRASNRRYAIVDPGTALLLIERENGSVITVERIKNSVLGAAWFSQDKVLFWTELELWVWDRATRQHTLVTRSSEPILYAAWHPSGDATFVTTSQGTFLWDMTEIKRDAPALVSAAPILPLFIHPRGLAVYGLADAGLLMKNVR